MSQSCPSNGCHGVAVGSPTYRPQAFGGFAYKFVCACGALWESDASDADRASRIEVVRTGS
jgi:hypothetical protein